MCRELQRADIALSWQGDISILVFELASSIMLHMLFTSHVSGFSNAD